MLKYILYKRDISEQANSFSYEEQMLRILPPTYESTIMNIGQAIEAKARQEERQQTRQAIEMLKQGFTPEQVEKETHLGMDMVIFFRDNMVH